MSSLNESAVKFVMYVLSLVLASTATGAEQRNDPSPSNEPSPSEVQVRGQAMMDRARRMSDMRVPGAPAFRLEASFSFNGKSLETIRGTYAEVWVSKSQWRRELVVNNLHRLEIGGSDRRWVLDAGPDFPAMATRLPDLMNVFPLNRLKFTFQSISDDSSGNMQAECAITKPGAGNERYAFCFDKQTGFLLEKIYPQIRPTNAVSFGCSYGTFSKFGDFWYPRAMVCREDKHQVLEAKVVELSVDPSPDPDLFKPPQGAVERRQCDGTVQPPKPVSSPEPKYPSGTSSQFGLVTLSLVVDKDGKPLDLKVRESSSRPFEKPAIAAVSRWTFRPGTCNGEPIPMEIAVQVQFQRYN